MRKIPVAILGATGTVGQKFVELLSKHPWFTIIAVAASERSLGKPYREAVHWIMPTPMPPQVADLTVLPCEPTLDCQLVFSALDSTIAGTVESAFAEAGYTVISNSHNHRMAEDVPLVIPEVNGDHLQLIDYQRFKKGKLITNPNCSTIGMCLALKPLFQFGLEAVHVTTLQAISGAGYPGIPSLDILGNVIPFIRGEEHKVETEPLKILGQLEGSRIHNANLRISAQCNRVPVEYGHLECLSVRFKNKPVKEEIIASWTSFQSDPQTLKLPSAPIFPVHFFHEENFPQPKLHCSLENGMAVSVGRLLDCPILDYKFTILSHNTVRGAAGGAILIGELLVKKGYIS